MQDTEDFLKVDKDTDELITNFLADNNISDKSQIVQLVKLAAEIPWGKGRTIEEVLVTKKVGTCTGKHLVLQACLDCLGIPFKQVMCTFRWGEQGMRFPAYLQAILDEGEWDHGHNFVQLDGVDIDITWNSKLRDHGFITIPDDWDGKTSVVAVKMKERWDNMDMKAMKIKLIESLTPELRERRERFLAGFIAWIASINS